MTARDKSAKRNPRRGARLLGLAVTAVLLAAGAFAGHLGWTYLHRPDVMPLGRVVVDGELEHLRRDQLEAVVTLAVWGNYFTVDIDNVRRAAKSLPWVETASVRRLWPDSLVIRVREREPFARWGDGALISRSGEVFRPASLDGVDNLPLLEGPDDRGIDVVHRYEELRQTFAPPGHVVTRLRLDARGGWHLWIDDGIEIALGAGVTEDRLERVLTVLRVLGSENGRIASIDARYATGTALRWRAENPADSSAGGASKASQREHGNESQRG